MKIILLLCLCLTLYIRNPLSGQTLRGKMTDAITDQAIPFVNLSLTALTDPKQIRYSSTDTLGAFAFSRVPNGRYIFSATLTGYQKLQREIMLTDKQPTMDLGNLSMSAELNMLQTVTVTGSTLKSITHNGQLKISVADNVFF